MTNNRNDQIWQTLIIVLGVALIVFAAFGAALWYDFAPIDDVELIYRNMAIRGMTPEHLYAIFTRFDPELYIPLTLFSFQINYLISELHPWSYHLVNLLLHTANVLLVLQFFRLFKIPRFPALLAGALFAVHPIVTEPVVWIAARKDLLMGFFFLAALVAWMSRKERDGKSAIRYSLSLLFFLLALLSKITAAVLPLLFLGWHVLIVRRPLWKRDWIALLPFFLLAGIFIIIAVLGKEGVIARPGFMMMLFLAAKGTALTLLHIVWPIGLFPIYEQIAAPSAVIQSAVIVAFVIVLLGSGFALYHLRMPRVAFALLLFFLTLLPSLASPQKGEALLITADRYAYLSLIGISLLFGIGIAALELRYHILWMRRVLRLSGIALIIILVLFAQMTTNRWSTSETLFRKNLEAAPASVLTRIGLMNVYLERGETERASDLLHEGLRIRDDTRLHVQTGILERAAGRRTRARAQFEIVHKRDPRNPEAHFWLGLMAEEEGDSAAAQALFEEAVALDSSFVAAHVRLGRILLAKGDVDAAREHSIAAFRFNPNDPEVLALQTKLATH